jgi:hypothetical protein
MKLCIECVICFDSRCGYFGFAILQFTACAMRLRQVHDGIILCICYLFYWLLLFIYVETKWIWKLIQLCLLFCIASYRQCIVLCPTEVDTLRPSMLGRVPHCRQPPQVGVSGYRRVFTQAIPVHAKESERKEHVGIQDLCDMTSVTG